MVMAIDMSLDYDIEIMKKYYHGKLLDEIDRFRVEQLSMIGLMKTGIHIEINVENETITLKGTAKTVGLGRKLVRDFQTLKERILQKYPK